jgi:hypothetical protein
MQAACVQHLLRTTLGACLCFRSCQRGAPRWARIVPSGLGTPCRMQEHVVLGSDVPEAGAGTNHAGS